MVADVDNDGHADIVVTVATRSGGNASVRNTGVHVLQDVANQWARTRRIWNQHSYHITNVNEDGTIPLVETPNWLVPGLNNFRLNAFLPGETADQSDSFTYRASDGTLDLQRRHRPHRDPRREQRRRASRRRPSPPPPPACSTPTPPRRPIPTPATS